MTGDTEIFELLKLDPHIQDVIQHLPLYDGKFDPQAYIDWELKVDNEFDEHDLSEKQKICIASNVLIEYALLEWKHICRHNKVPESWEDFKFLFRDAFVPAYYADYLLAKLDNLKQDSRTVKAYYHDFKICIMFGGLDECMEDVMSRFMRGFNSEIQTLLISNSYSHIGQLFCLALNAEKEILLSVNTCKNDVTHNVQNLSILHANEEQQIVEPTVDFPLSQNGLLAVPCDKEELCADDSFTPMPQVTNKCDTFGLEPYKYAEDKLFHPITCAQDELNLLSSLNTLGYIEFDILCNLNCLKEKLKFDSGLPSFNHCSLHAIGKYDSKGEYLVHKVYICSNLKYPFGPQYHDQIEGCTNTNDVLQSFPSFSHMQQDKYQEGEHGSLLPTTHPPTKVKPRTVCCQEGENDEDIIGSNMTMPTTSIPKVQPFYMRLIIDAFDELVLHHKMCIFLFSELLTWIKGRFDCIWKAWKVNEVDWGPNPSITNVLHLDTTSLLVQGKKEIKSNTFGAGFGLQDSSNL